MRPYSPKEKQIIQQLVEADQEVFTLIDFVRPFWPVGQFEISTFQQVVRVHLDDQQGMTDVMSHLMDVLSLIKHLEYRSYVSGWDAFPQEDNTEKCGDRKDSFQPYFLTDLSVASDLLKYGNKKFKLSTGLSELVKRKFRSVAQKRHSQVLRTLIGGFAILAVIGLISIYTNYRVIEKGIKVNLAEIQSENEEVLENQKLNQTIIDSLHRQSKQLIIIANQIARNTENIQEMESEIDLQKRRIINLQYRSRRLHELGLKNQQILEKTDSLLNKLPLN